MLHNPQQSRFTIPPSFQQRSSTNQSRHFSYNLTARKQKLTRANSYQQHKFLQSSDPTSLPMGKRRGAKRKDHSASDQPQARPSFAAAEGVLLPIRLSCSTEAASVAVAVGASLRVYDQRYRCAGVEQNCTIHHLIWCTAQSICAVLPAALLRLGTFPW